MRLLKQKKKQIYCKLEEQAFHIKRILFLNSFGVIPFTTLSAKDKSSATNKHDHDRYIVESQE